jgi:hypothetical protein
MLLIVATVVLSKSWLRRIHSITIQNRNVLIETSPDGRLANPYRNMTSIPMSYAIVALTAALAMLITVGVALYLGSFRVKFSAAFSVGEGSAKSAETIASNFASVC